jgi:Family of unknown function (DUF6281)
VPWCDRTIRLRRIETVNAIVAVVAIAAVTYAAPASGAPARQAACADVVRYHGTLYEGTFVGRALRRASQRLHAVRPGCNDTPGANEPDTGVTLANIVGVSPSLALLATDNARHVYLVAGVFPENPNHPLHVALYGNRARPNECVGAKLVGSVHIRGTVTETPLPFNLLSVRSTTRVTSLLLVDAWTRLGFPFTRRLVKGNRVDVAAARCRRPNTTRAMLVARRITLR